MGLVGELHRQLAGAIMDRDPERARSLALDHAERSIERQDAIQRLGAAR
jgi:DNA-binding FadR family transcriptional regulator